MADFLAQNIPPPAPLTEIGGYNPGGPFRWNNATAGVGKQKQRFFAIEGTLQRTNTRTSTTGTGTETQTLVATVPGLPVWNLNSAGASIAVTAGGTDIAHVVKNSTAFLYVSQAPPAGTTFPAAAIWLDSRFTAVHGGGATTTNVVRVSQVNAAGGGGGTDIAQVVKNSAGFQYVSANAWDNASQPAAAVWMDRRLTSDGGAFGSVLKVSDVAPGATLTGGTDVALVTRATSAGAHAYVGSTPWNTFASAGTTFSLPGVAFWHDSRLTTTLPAQGTFGKVFAQAGTLTQLNRIRTQSGTSFQYVSNLPWAVITTGTGTATATTLATGTQTQNQNAWACWFDYRFTSNSTSLFTQGTGSTTRMTPVINVSVQNTNQFGNLLITNEASTDFVYAHSNELAPGDAKLGVWASQPANQTYFVKIGSVQEVNIKAQGVDLAVSQVTNNNPGALYISNVPAPVISGTVNHAYAGAWMDARFTAQHVSAGATTSVIRVSQVNAAAGGGGGTDVAQVAKSGTGFQYVATTPWNTNASRAGAAVWMDYRLLTTDIATSNLYQRNAPYVLRGASSVLHGSGTGVHATIGSGAGITTLTSAGNSFSPGHNGWVSLGFEVSASGAPGNIYFVPQGQIDHTRFGAYDMGAVVNYGFEDQRLTAFVTKVLPPMPFAGSAFRVLVSAESVNSANRFVFRVVAMPQNIR